MSAACCQGRRVLSRFEHLVTLLQKKGFANRVKQFRPITVLPVLYKVYSRVLLLLTDGRLERLHAPQFAFRPGHQTHEVIFILRNLIEKALEWTVPVFILDGDLHKAYDHTRHLCLIEGLRQKNVPRVLIAAWVRELRRCRSVFTIDGDTYTDPVSRTRSLLQGDPAAPALFNATLDVPATAFQKKARQEGWGYTLDGNINLSLVLFADNFWLIAKNPNELSKMLKCWLELLAEFGWKVPLEEATWCTTSSDTNTHWRVAIDSQTVPRSSRKKGFKALGVILTFDNSCELELEARIASAWRAFYKFKHVLCCRDADIGRRYKLLFTLVQTALCWCWSSCNLTVTQLSKIRGVQQTMMRKMLCLRREKSETLEDYMHKANSKVKCLKEKHAVKDWDWLYHRSVFSWAGHVARMPAYDPKRLTHLLLKFRSWRWICNVSSTNGGNQLHGKRLHIWRWERAIYKYHGDEDWQEVAQNSTTWNSQLDAMATWRSTNR